MTTHSFDIVDAQTHGIEAAVILHNLRFWLQKNAANHKHAYDDYYWTYNSANAFAELFPYMTATKVHRVLKNLEDKGVIFSANYNKDQLDRTKWYTLPEFAIAKQENPCQSSNPPILQNCKMHSSKLQIASDKSANCYTDNKHTDIKPLKKINKKSSQDEELFCQLWNAYPADRRTTKARVWKYFQRAVKNHKINKPDKFKQILEAVEQQKLNNWAKHDNGFQQTPPQLPTWLNNQDWEQPIVKPQRIASEENVKQEPTKEQVMLANKLKQAKKIDELINEHLEKNHEVYDDEHYQNYFNTLNIVHQQIIKKLNVKTISQVWLTVCVNKRESDICQTLRQYLWKYDSRMRGKIQSRIKQNNL